MNAVSTAPATFTVDAIAQCSETIREHSKSFALASRLLPQPARDEAVVLYAWCRYADDAVDEAPPGEAPGALARLERELDGIYAGESQTDVVLAAFQQLVERRTIPRAYPAALLAGMRMDVEGARYDDEEALLLYCYRVASVVGLMMCHVMGVRGDAKAQAIALQQACHLGLAMQITNICRDVAEDWGRGRRYLPADAVARAGLDPAPEAPAEGADLPDAYRAPLSTVIDRLLRRADTFYASSDRGLLALPWQSALAVGAARWVYRDIGRVLQGWDCDPGRGRAYTSKGRKFVLVGRSLLSLAASVPARVWLRVTGRGRMRPPAVTLEFDGLDHLDGAR